MRSNPTLKAIDGAVGRAAMWACGLHQAVRRLVVPRYRHGGVPDQVRAIVAIKLCCLGDGILAVPALRALRSRWPGAKLIVVCTPRSREAFENLPFIDECLVLPITGFAGAKELLRSGLRVLPYLRQVRRERPDIAVDLDLYYKSTPVLAYLTGAPVRVGFDTEGLSRAGLFTASTGRGRWKWECECFLDVVGLLGVPADDTRLEFPVRPEAQQRAEQILAEAGIGAGDRFVAFCPGSSKNWTIRRWPAARFGQVAAWAAEHTGAKPVLVGADYERDLCEKVAEHAGVPVLNLAGRASVQETAAVLTRAAALVTNDTGPMHLALALGIPVVAIFGPGNDRKWAPRGPRDVTLTSDACERRPCYHLSNMPDCTDAKCLTGIQAEQVVGALGEVLEVTCAAGG